MQPTTVIELVGPTMLEEYR